LGRDNALLIPLGDTQLLTQLKMSGLHDDFIKGKLRCASCGKTLEADNVGVVMLDDISLNGLASCSEDSCIDRLKDLMSIPFHAPNKKFKKL
jgi:hypothetical protein